MLYDTVGNGWEADYLMKIFEIRHPGTTGYTWSFWCRADKCDDCKLRFLCYTNNKIIIENDKLVHLLFDSSRNYHNPQAKARKVFFKHIMSRKKIGRVV